MIVQASQGLKQPRPAVLGIASGIFFLTFFGAVWGFTSAAFLSGAFQVVAFLLVGLVTLWSRQEIMLSIEVVRGRMV